MSEWQSGDELNSRITSLEIALQIEQIRNAAVRDGLRRWLDALKFGIGAEIDALQALREALK